MIHGRVQCVIRHLIRLLNIELTQQSATWNWERAAGPAWRKTVNSANKYFVIKWKVHWIISLSSLCLMLNRHVLTCDILVVEQCRCSGSIPGLTSTISETGYLLFPSRDMSELLPKRPKSSKQPTSIAMELRGNHHFLWKIQILYLVIYFMRIASKEPPAYGIKP